MPNIKITVVRSPVAVAETPVTITRLDNCATSIHQFLTQVYFQKQLVGPFFLILIVHFNLDYTSSKQDNIQYKILNNLTFPKRINVFPTAHALQTYLLLLDILFLQYITKQAFLYNLS